DHLVELDHLLAAVDAALEDERAGVDVARPHLHPERHAALLPVVLLVARSRVAEVGDDPLLAARVIQVALNPVALDAPRFAAARQGGDQLVDEPADLRLLL